MNFVKQSLEIKSNGNTVITNGIIYSYIDRWSDPKTWGGESPPREGDSVYIPFGQNVLLDVSTPILYSVIIEGTLIFEDKNMEFNAYFLICMKGKVQIGTKEKPFKSKLVITMYGNKQSKQLPEFGNKVWAFHQATLDMHGIPKSFTWTLLAEIAVAGATQVNFSFQ